MRKLIAAFLLLFSLQTFAQSNLSHKRISIITCGPGEDLYSLFGHTAIRVIDSANHSDIVYNWGGFTFDQPGFYIKFLRGKLLYYSSADNYPDFMYEYVYEHRSVYEQVLNLDSASSQKIIDAISFNMQGDNKFYKYDFLLDNCTTRVRNIIYESNKNALIKSSVVPEGTTSRDLIHYYVERGGEPWIVLGMDILLGTQVDKPVTNNEAMFTPEFLMKGFSSSLKQNKPFVNSSSLLLQGDQPQGTSNKYVPLIILTLISVVLFAVSGIKAAWAKKITSFVDVLILYTTGLLGILIMFMWFATDHTVCKNNFNLVWAMPLNFPVAFIVLKKPAWLGNYFFILSVITALFLAAWFWLPQDLNIALLPVVLFFLNRYISLAGSFKQRV